MVDGKSANDAPCVLIVEDEVLVRMFAVDVLEDAGFVVEQAANGHEALARFESLKGKLLVTIIDLGLPDRSGDEVAAEIRARDGLVPILIASGRSERELKDRFANDPAIGVLGKPYTEPMLLEALGRLGLALP